MKRCELLSPAGNMEMLKYAVMYGADAVYLAGTRFGARKFANNFTEEELTQAVKFAHLYNVKVYVTINTLIYESEVKSFVENVKFIHSIGVDAVLVQDFGMMNLIREIAPDLEIHASTQFHTAGQKTIDLLKSIGVKRVVLDRETSIAEIKKIATPLELEVFIHGALCVSYSGQCLFSSHVLGRSGNRGECAGLCRLPYKIKTAAGTSPETKYYLSLKDLCAAESIYDLIDAGVSSLKIEGRMKSPEYVGYMTKIYRELVDSYYTGERRKLTDEEKKNIAILFNRGLTPGFLNDTKSEDMVNLASPNHIGIHLGTYSPHKDKVALKLSEDLHQGDTIRFKEDSQGMVVNFLYDAKDDLINYAEKGTTVYVDNFLQLEHTGELRLVGSITLNKEIQNLPKRTVPIEMSFRAKIGKPKSLDIEEESHNLHIEGPIPDRAQNRPITKEDVIKQLTKTGTTPYTVSKIDVSLDEDLFINLKDLNVLRREALEKLDAIRTQVPKAHFENYSELPTENTPSNRELHVVVETEEQYFASLSRADKIFSSNEELLEKYPSIYPKYVSTVESITRNTYIISDYGQLTDSTAGDIIYTDYMLNVTNSHTINALLKKKVAGVLLSVELEDAEISIVSNSVDLAKTGILIYGNIELMKMKYDSLKGTATHLIDRNESAYRIKKDNYFNYLMSSKPIDKLKNLPKYLNMGFGFYRIDFTRESREECAKILEKYHTIK